MLSIAQIKHKLPSKNRQRQSRNNNDNDFNHVRHLSRIGLQVEYTRDRGDGKDFLRPAKRSVVPRLVGGKPGTCEAERNPDLLGLARRMEPDPGHYLI